MLVLKQIYPHILILYKLYMEGIFVKEQNLIVSTILLTVTSFFTRTIGMISVIFLSQVLGSSGMGLYQLIMSFYSTAIVFASAGLSASVSKVIAEELGNCQFHNVHKIMRLAFILSGFTSFSISLLLFIFAPFIADHFIYDIESTLSLRILAISIPFMACSSCFKGYFYATKKTVYPASADILEQIVKMLLLILLVKIYAPLGDRYTYGAIGLGLTIGEITSWTYLLSLYILEKRREPIAYRSSRQSASTHSLFGKLIYSLLPIALVSYIGCLFVSVENILIPSGLQKFGSSQNDSLSIYGMLRGMVMPILFFPSAFLTAFSTTLVPEISRANILNHQKKVVYTTNRVIQFTFMLSILVTGVFINYSQELGIVIYHNPEIGPILRILSFIVPFMYVEVVTDGILKGLGKQVSSLKYSIVDSVFRTLTIYFILPIKGIHAFIGIMMISNILTSTLSFNKLLETTSIKFQVVHWIMKPILAALAGGTFSKLILNVLFIHTASPTYKLILGISLTSFIYIIVLILIEGFTHEDLAWLKKHLFAWSH